LRFGVTSAMLIHRLCCLLIRFFFAFYAFMGRYPPVLHQDIFSGYCIGPDQCIMFTIEGNWLLEYISRVSHIARSPLNKYPEEPRHLSQCVADSRVASATLPGALNVFSSAPLCSQIYHNHSRDTPEPVISSVINGSLLPGFAPGWNRTEGPGQGQELPSNPTRWLLVGQTLTRSYLPPPFARFG